MNTISKFWRWFTTPHIIAKWKWEGDDLRNLPCAAWRDFRRAIRSPIIRFLAGSDLIVVGDIYCSKSIGDPIITISSNQHADMYGNISAYDGPTAIVPRGCKPPAPTIRAVTDGDGGDARTWATVKPEGKLTNVIGGVGEVQF